jgi:large subunit ribosomal protein L16
MQPKKTKYRKQFKGRNTGAAKRGTKVSFGEFGLKAVELGRLSGKHIEAARRTLSRHLKRGGKVWIRVFPDKPVSKKPLEVRQGSGKGNVEFWVALIQPGRMLFEIEGVPEELAREAFKLAAAKLPVKSTFVARTVM